MSKTVAVSFEFFPPKTPKGLQRLHEVATVLNGFSPEYFSVTFGAGGSTTTQTPETVAALRQGLEGGEVAPHISCISSSKVALQQMLTEYLSQGVKRLVVLRGDMPSGLGAAVGPMRYASDLVAFIRQEFGQRFTLEVGCYPECHPEAVNLREDFTAFVTKVKAGADRAITQYFYNSDSYFRFVERSQLAGLTIPVVPGIMPIHDFERLRRFSQRCGADLPQWLFKEMIAHKGDQHAMRQCGISVVTSLCDCLLRGGAPGLHFYTLNQSEVTQAILHNLQDLGYCFDRKGDSVSLEKRMLP